MASPVVAKFHLSRVGPATPFWGTQLASRLISFFLVAHRLLVGNAERAARDNELRAKAAAARPQPMPHTTFRFPLIGSITVPGSYSARKGIFG